MSQEKVERYKKEKANRKQIMKREKLKSRVAGACGILVCAALIGWAGYSGYVKWEEAQPTKYTEINTDAISDYLNGLETAEEEAAD